MMYSDGRRSSLSVCTLYTRYTGAFVHTSECMIYPINVRSIKGRKDRSLAQCYAFFGSALHFKCIFYTFLKTSFQICYICENFISFFFSKLSIEICRQLSQTYFNLETKENFSLCEILNRTSYKHLKWHFIKPFENVYVNYL